MSESMPIAIRPPREEDRLVVPGPMQPAFIASPKQPKQPYLGPDPSFIRIVKTQRDGLVIGNRICFAGDVIKVDRIPTDKTTGRPIALPIMPAPSLLLGDQAHKLIDLDLAEPHHGPATVQLTNPTRDEFVDLVKASAERADLAPQINRTAERAVAAPQRGAM